MPLTWTDTLATGIRQIDLQHQELIELINTLEAVHAAGRRGDVLGDALPRLNAYVMFHFATEEAYIGKVSGAHADRHRLQHQVFTQRVAELGNAPAEAIDIPGLIDYLKSWIIEHIMKTDRELARQFLAGSL